MQKMILAIAMVSLIAAGCSGQQSAELEVKQENEQSSESSKVDAIIEEINASLITEEHLSTQSNEDIITSDKEIIINGSEEVSNAAQN